MTELKFGERLRAVRKNAACSQKDFCKLLDMPQSTLSAYETDKMQPTVSTLVKVAETFNVSIDWLCGIGENNEHQERCSGNDFLGVLSNFFEAAEKNGITPELTLKWKTLGTIDEEDDVTHISRKELEELKWL